MCDIYIYMDNDKFSLGISKIRSLAFIVDSIYKLILCLSYTLNLPSLFPLCLFRSPSL